MKIVAILLAGGLVGWIYTFWSIRTRLKRRQGHTEASPRRCTATRTYNFTGSKNFKCRIMHGRKARCNLTEDHSDGSLYLHWDPVWKCSWVSGPEAFK